MAIYSVIKNDGPGNVLIWECEEEDFNNNSQLIVAENEEALFVKDGIVAQTFKAGKYTLSTSNYPFIGEFRKKFSGGVSSFSNKVYFVNKAHAMELYWGTDPAMQIEDNRFGIVSVGALGSYSIKVNESKKFMLKLLSNNEFCLTADRIAKYFRTALNSKIKSNLAKIIKQSGKSIIELITDYDEIASIIKPYIGEILSEYGIQLVDFYISNISISDDDPSYQRIADAVSRKKRMLEYGDDYNRFTSEALLETLSKSDKPSVIMGGDGLSRVLEGMTTQMLSPLKPQTTRNNTICAVCGEKTINGAKFCPNCGSEVPENRYCTVCGNAIQSNMKFCPSCGEKIH